MLPQILKVLLVTLLPTTAMAKVVYDPETSTLRVTGPTSTAQVVTASNYMNKYRVKYIEMWGPGGEMVAGIHLGNRIAKENDVIVVVPKGKRCVSACGLSALAASHIRIDGKMLLHRPYTPGVSIMDRLEDAMAFMGKGYIMADRYLIKHGYSPHVMDAMMEYTSPCKFMVYEDIVVKERSDLKMWALDKSRCEVLKVRAGR